ncbi:hypothetical protein [Capnocytophaga gingivalis]|jgi:hypothetical protein|uniref:Lipoprotein n=1 Tax=Capnocytophaga gingivalis TaxID=1017 RepID=A0ABU5YFK1_9FLAO|nr:hypothetical protein [Capnocytophaga gingivalis]MEB3041438.1 hypothetical protein [Capnocytophaga gingivalis]
MKKGGKLLCLFIALGAICCKPIIYDDPYKIITIKGWVLDAENIPLDSVEILNFKNEVMTYSNKEGYFEIHEQEYILQDDVFFQRANYITDTIRYYTFSQIRGKWFPYSGLDTIVLKKEIKTK